MAEVHLRQVRKAYGDLEVIHGVSCDIVDGEFVVILGPSGCGKSTLLRMIAGLEIVTGGDIAIGGRVVNQVEPKDRDIAMVFQNYALYPHMSVFENMAYGLKLRKLSADDIRKRVDKAAQILELQSLLERTPRQLSGGQRQRVAMGRAIVREPAVFLFDEPLSNLDAKLRVQMRLEIKKLHQRLKTTSVYVTHDQVEAMTLGQRLIVMNGGIAEQIATPLEVYNRPASVFVAGFIGSPAMNLLDGAVEQDGFSVSIGGGAAIKIGFRAKAGQKVVLGIRPEDLGGGAAGQPVDLTVDMVEPLGADTLVHGHIGGSTNDVTARLAGTAKVAPGERLPLALPLGKIHLFDAETGRRIEG